MQGDALVLSADTMALLVDTIVLSPKTIALLANTIALQKITKINLLQIN